MLDFRKYRQNFIRATERIDNKQWNDLSNNTMFVDAPELTHDHVKNCSVFCNRAQMLEALPKNSVVAEIGTQYGEFAEKIMRATQPEKLHIIDLDLSLIEKNLDKRDSVRAGKASGSIKFHQGDSSAVIDTFPDGYFDWIYIDGDHSYKGVKKDIEKAYPKVKESGLLVFNDYTHWSPYEMIPYGIPRAVNEFCLAHDWEFVHIALDSFLTYQDVAIRKIASA